MTATYEPLTAEEVETYRRGAQGLIWRTEYVADDVLRLLATIDAERARADAAEAERSKTSDMCFGIVEKLSDAEDALSAERAAREAAEARAATLEQILRDVQKRAYHEPDSDLREMCEDCQRSPYNVPPHGEGCLVPRIAAALAAEVTP